MFTGIIKLGIPSLRDGNAYVYAKEEYQAFVVQKSNEEPQEEILEGVISANQAVDRLRPIFQIWILLKTIYIKLGPLSYEIHSEVELV